MGGGTKFFIVILVDVVVANVVVSVVEGFFRESEGVVFRLGAGDEARGVYEDGGWYAGDLS